MVWQPLFMLLLLIGIFLGLIRKHSPDLLLVGAAVAAGVVGIITPAEAFSGFSNSGMLTVAALYIVVAGLTETGALDYLGRHVFGRVRSEAGALGRMALTVPVVSAFLNNTPVVAMFISIINKWSRSSRVPVSKLLIPLSYFSILGGTCTLIGTSTNLVVNGLMQERWSENAALYKDLYSMGMFEIAVVGVPLALAGIAYILFFSRKMLPATSDFDEYIGSTRREYLANLRVTGECPLIGRNVEDAGLRHLTGLFLIEIMRNGDIIAPVRPDEIIREGDELTFTGIVSTIVELEKIQGLEILDERELSPDTARRKQAMMCEVVVSNTSPLIGKTVRESDFRATYNAGVIAVHRGGTRLAGKVGDMELRPGDTLLIQAGPHFERAHRNNPDFYLVRGIEDSRPIRHEKALVSLGLLVLLVVLLSVRVIPIVYSAFLVAGLMVATRCVTFSDARQQVDWSTLVTIAAALGLGKALVNSGLVGLVTGTVTSTVGQWGPVAVLACIFLLTSIFTEIITNNAAAALMFPFAVSFAMTLGVSPRPFVMAIVFAASASFASPLGYQTNLMVYGPGGYRLTDFLKMGLPMNLLVLVVTTLLVPVFWPF